MLEFRDAPNTTSSSSPPDVIVGCLLCGVYFIVFSLIFPTFRTNKSFQEKNIPSSPHPYTPCAVLHKLRTKFGTWRRDMRRVGPYGFCRGPGHLGETLLSVSFRVGPYRFCSDGNPTNLSMIIIRSYLILSDTHVLDCLKVLLNK